MKVRIEAQLALNGTVRCELVITGPHDAEVHVPARFTTPDDEGVLELLADGAPFAIEVDAPLLQSVSADAGRLVDVRGVSNDPEEQPTTRDLTLRLLTTSYVEGDLDAETYERLRGAVVRAGAEQGDEAGAYVMSTRERTGEPVDEGGFVDDFTSRKGD